MALHKRASDVHKLTRKQADFIEHYLRTGNARQSAIDAGYKPLSADQASVKVLCHPEIARIIRERREQIEHHTVISVASVVNKIAEIAFSDATVKTKKGKIHMVVSTKDRLRALEMLGKHLGIFQADSVRGKVDVSVTARKLTDEQLFEKLREIYERSRLDNEYPQQQRLLPDPETDTTAC